MTPFNNNYNQEHVTTKFNGSLLALERLNKILENCNIYSTMCSDISFENARYLILWKGILKCFEKEINSKMSKKEVFYIKKMFEKTITIQKVTPIVRTPYGRQKGFNPDAFVYCTRLLNHIETNLRKIADNKGLLLINEEEEEGM